MDRQHLGRAVALELEQRAIAMRMTGREIAYAAQPFDLFEHRRRIIGRSFESDVAALSDDQPASTAEPEMRCRGEGPEIVGHLSPTAVMACGNILFGEEAPTILGQVVARIVAHRTVGGREMALPETAMRAGIPAQRHDRASV